MRRRSGLAIIAAGLWASFSYAQDAPLATFASNTLWSIADEAFGGWSGLDVDPDGVGFTAISDRGLIVSGRLLRNDRGWLVGVDAGPIVSMAHTDGGEFPRYWNDSEGLAVGPDGRVYVSFEAEDRINVYADAAADKATELPRHPDFEGFQNNSAMEALAIGPDGALYTLPERSGELDRPFPVYRYRDGAWQQPFTLPRRDDFLPVGADIGPDNRFYLLERRLASSQLGFASRVRRFDLGEDALTNEVTLFTSEVRQHDNLEGLAVWQDAFEIIHLTMISDDNFRFFQASEIVEYVVDPMPGLDRENETN
ncbi:esterase-like activity of phytase family protein [Maritimibacter dapengensis]|uniref:Esterase-like activity of phytase family protein n=1 Tax=Maritimibacter dapengensis TaxID=2836868 RepID=A0ABS6T568_9RHOB|nr:esterase-like activity of phytase family protein [Maritimibacter dapengensis]MBV7380359.1 esterase-like activity of phytase family protein [Maritimibacter dapengensis]